MGFAFVLKLESNKYYIGITTNINFTLEEYINHNETEWTKQYNPIELTELISNVNSRDKLDKVTIRFMKKYGIENVRGGNFNEIKLHDEVIIKLENMIKYII